MRYLLITIGVIIAIPILVYVIGVLLPEGHTATVSRVYEASHEEVWNAVTDVNEYPEWRSHLDKVEVLSDSTENLRWREFYDNNQPMTFEVTEKIDRSRVVSVIADENLPFGGQWTYEFEPVPEGTKLTITEDGEVYNPIFRFVSYFFMSQTATMEQYLSDLETGLN